MAATITATGTWSVPQVLHRPVGGSGSEAENSTGTAFDSRISLQRGLNLYDELNQFVALMSAALGIPGFAVLDQLRVMIGDLRRNPAMGERVYQP
jgi:hypothetical protein